MARIKNGKALMSFCLETFFLTDYECILSRPNPNRYSIKMSEKLVEKWLIIANKYLKTVSVLTSVMRVGSDTFGDPIFQKGLQN